MSENSDVAATTMVTGASEAEQLALEVSGELLPPKNLVDTIERHLTAIRKKYSTVADITNQAKWVAGELIVNGINPAKINTINSSKYGPVESKTIFSSGDLSIYLLQFSRPYNPERLAKVLGKEFGVESAEPNGSIGDSTGITCRRVSDVLFNYTFKKGWGDCPSGCIHKHFWEFSVDDSNKANPTVNLKKEYGD